MVTGLITFVGAIVRFWQIGYRSDGGTPLFDEKYYAVQAAEMVRNGGIEDNPAFNLVVHPPLGKQLIALGEMLMGYNPIGWRFSSAIAGTVCILLIIRVARRMTRSTLLGGIAGVLLICDGVTHVQSRTALLDIFQALFVLAAFACVIADRDQVRARLALAVADDPDAPGVGQRGRGEAGRPLVAVRRRHPARPAPCAVKWSGVYWVAAFGILTVIWDITARREAGIRHPISAVVRRDLVPSLWSLAVVPVLIYLASWWAWFASESGWDRHVGGRRQRLVRGAQLVPEVDVAVLQGNPEVPQQPVHPDQPRRPAPLGVQALVVADRHPAGAVLRALDTTTGCDADTCVKRIFLIGTPAMWWISLFVLAWALWKAIGRLDWRYVRGPGRLRRRLPARGSSTCAGRCTSST